MAALEPRGAAGYQSCTVIGRGNVAPGRPEVRLESVRWATVVPTAKPSADVVPRAVLAARRPASAKLVANRMRLELPVVVVNGEARSAEA
jgi:hypothetical protein